MGDPVDETAAGAANDGAEGVFTAVVKASDAAETPATDPGLERLTSRISASCPAGESTSKAMGACLSGLVAWELSGPPSRGICADAAEDASASFEQAAPTFRLSGDGDATAGVSSFLHRSSAGSADDTGEDIWRLPILSPETLEEGTSREPAA